MKEIGCFITGAWTEAGAMTLFLKKINNNFNYVQLLPNKPKYRRGLDQKISGLTGDSLINEMINRIRKYRDRLENYVAFIVEDDLDCRFHGKTSVEIAKIKDEIQHEVDEIMGKHVPVFFLFASPEIEVWFLTDWNNTFCKVYRNDFFTNRLKLFINRNCIAGYWEAGIENFGMANGQYTKISDEIMHAVQFGVKDELFEIYKNKQQVYAKKLQDIFENRELYYSKRLHGDLMLRQLTPENLLSKCHIYFAPAYYDIKNFIPEA